MADDERRPEDARRVMVRVVVPELYLTDLPVLERAIRDSVREYPGAEVEVHVMTPRRTR